MDAGHLFTLGGVAAALLLLFRKADFGTARKPETAESVAAEIPEPNIVNGRFRILDAETLIYELGLAPSIANIKSNLRLTNESWHRDALPLIHNFLTLVQRLPASESHHHAGDGGLAKHSLNVAAMALLASTAKSWPPGAKTEDIARLGAVWRYGILTAALLHDIGKVITSFEIPLYKSAGDEHPVIWQPDTGGMVESGCAYYQVLFPDNKTPYSVHKTLGWLFFQNIVPAHSRAWMRNSDPNLVNALRGYLGGTDEESPLADVVKSADMASVSLDLKSGPRQRFASAKRKPLNEVVMDTLIEMLRDRGAFFSIATTAGGDLFHKDGVIYMMSKNVPDGVRSFLEANEPALARSFPSDNQRIFNTLLEYGLVLPNSFDGYRAVCNINVTFAKTGEDPKTYPFTVLKFKPQTLFPDGQLPAEFMGEIIETETAVKPQIKRPAATSEPAAEAAEPASDIAATSPHTVSSVPDGYEIPPPPTKRPVPAPEVTGQETAKGLADINDFLNSHNLLSEDEEDDEELPVGEPVLTAKSPPPFKKEKNEPDKVNTKSEGSNIPFHIPAKTKIQSKGLQALFADASKSTENPDNGKSEKMQNKTENSGTGISDGFPETTDLPYESTAQAGLDEAAEERDAMSDKSPRSVAVFSNETVLQDEPSDQTPEGRLKKHRNILKAEGNRFLNWMAAGLGNGTIAVNQSNAPIHFVERGMLLVTPEIFKMYSQGFFDKNNPDCPGFKAQTAFLSLGLNERSKRTGIFSAQKDGKHMFSCFLIPENRLHYLISSGSRPANNIDLQIVESNFSRNMKRKVSK